MAKGLVNLAEHVSATTTQTVSIGLKKGKAPNLILTVSAKIMKVGAEKVVQQTSGDYTLEEDRFSHSLSR